MKTLKLHSKSSNSTRSIKRGGILYIKHSKTDKIDNTIPYIIQNASDIKSMGHNSLYGFNLKVSLPADKSRFLGTHLNDVGTIKRHFLIKFTLLSEKEHYWVLTGDSYNSNPSHPHREDAKLTGKIPDFYNEVKTQQDIFIRTSYLGYPACPPIVTAKRYTGEKMMEIVRNIVSACSVKTTEGQCDKDTDIMFRRVLYILEHNEFFERPSGLFMDTETLTRKSSTITAHLGVIVMELLEDYKTLADYKLDKYHIFTADEIHRAKTAYAHALYGFIRLLSVGYYHGDIHSSNVMINLKDTQYLDTTTYNGHAMMIDFGRTTKIINENELKSHPIYIYFTTIFPEIGISSSSLKSELSVLFNNYLSRQEDDNYYVQNKVKPENTFFSDAGFKRFFNTQVKREEVLDILVSILHKRHLRLQKLGKTTELHRIIKLAHIKGKDDIIDIFGKLSHLKFSTTSYMDLDLVLYYGMNSMRSLRENREIMREINEAKHPYPKDYKKKLRKGMRQILNE
jgi:hypothetical protein